jgi:hypothetical protein
LAIGRVPTVFIAAYGESKLRLFGEQFESPTSAYPNIYWLK